MAQNNAATDDPNAVKNESEATKTGERWEDHEGRRFTTEVTPEGVHLHYDDGAEEGPFDHQEFEVSREHLNYLGTGE